MTCSQHERQLVAIYRVHLSVIYDYTNVTSIRTSQRTMLHTVHNTLKNGRHESGINGTTYNRVEEHQLSTPFQRNLFTALDIHLELLAVESERCRIRHTFCIRLYDEMHLTKLTSSTTLLLMTIVCTSFLGNSLTIWNTRFLKCNVELLVIFQTPLQCTEMELTLTTNDDLT